MISLIVLVTEIQARKVAKAWSGSEDSDNIEIGQLGSSRRKIIAKKYEPQFVEPKKKKKKMRVKLYIVIYILEN